MPSLRTPEGTKEYQEYLSAVDANAPCVLCAKPSIQDFTHWKIVVNEFPYDVISKDHFMILPIRHTTEADLNEAEKQEYSTIKNNVIQEKYDYIIENATKNKSIPGHFHLHLFIATTPK